MPKNIEKKKVNLELAKLFVAFPVAGASDKEQEMRLRIFRDVLEHMPAWAVGKACAKFISGKVEGVNKGYAPSPAQLADATRDILSTSKTAEPGELHGRVFYDGEAPVVFVKPDDPMWDSLSEMHQRIKSYVPRAYQSSYTTEPGFFFPARYFEELEVA